jgi:hypothetical protein
MGPRTRLLHLQLKLHAGVGRLLKTNTFSLCFRAQRRDYAEQDDLGSEDCRQGDSDLHDAFRSRASIYSNENPAKWTAVHFSFL